LQREQQQQQQQRQQQRQQPASTLDHVRSGELCLQSYPKLLLARMLLAADKLARFKSMSDKTRAAQSERTPALARNGLIGYASLEVIYAKFSLSLSLSLSFSG